MIRIKAPFFIAGLTIKGEIGQIMLQEAIVVRAAPIVHYMIGWTESQVEAYCLNRNWTIEKI